MIRDALSVIPTRPVLYIAPVIVVLVMSIYYWDIYTKCTNNKQFRTSLNGLLHSVDGSAQFRLMDSTDFMWDRVRIMENFEPGRRKIECPFDWNWPSGERESLITSGLLTVLIFAQEGRIVEYFELRSDEVAFRGADFGLKSKNAVFSVRKNFDDRGGVTLTLKN